MELLLCCPYTVFTNVIILSMFCLVFVSIYYPLNWFWLWIRLLYELSFPISSNVIFVYVCVWCKWTKQSIFTLQRMKTLPTREEDCPRINRITFLSGEMIWLLLLEQCLNLSISFLWEWWSVAVSRQQCVSVLEKKTVQYQTFSLVLSVSLCSYDGSLGDWRQLPLPFLFKLPLPDRPLCQVRGTVLK